MDQNCEGVGGGLFAMPETMPIESQRGLKGVLALNST